MKRVDHINPIKDRIIGLDVRAYRVRLSWARQPYIEGRFFCRYFEQISPEFCDFFCLKMESSRMVFSGSRDWLLVVVILDFTVVLTISQYKIPVIFKIGFLLQHYCKEF